jgi:hypothetical protein
MVEAAEMQIDTSAVKTRNMVFDCTDNPVEVEVAVEAIQIKGRGMKTRAPLQNSKTASISTFAPKEETK